MELPAGIRIHPVFHVSLLSHFRPPQSGQIHHRPAPVEINGDLEFEVETILNVRRRKGLIEYLVKWLHYDDLENSWQPLVDVVNAWDLVKAFYKSHPKALRPSKQELRSLSLSLEGV